MCYNEELLDFSWMYLVQLREKHAQYFTENLQWSTINMIIYHKNVVR